MKKYPKMVKAIGLPLLMVLPIHLSALRIKDIPKGLYVKLTEGEYLSNAQAYIEIEHMKKGSEFIVFLFDGSAFRSLARYDEGDDRIAKSRGRLLQPDREFKLCKSKPGRFCPQHKEENIDGELVLTKALPEGGIHMTMIWPDGQTDDQYFIRVNDFFLARKYTRAVPVLHLFKNKNLEYYGYKMPKLSFAPGEIYRPAVESLRIRDMPSQKGQIIRTLDTGESLTIREVTKKIETIEKARGPWVKVEIAAGEQGFVFGGFLEPAPKE